MANRVLLGKGTTARGTSNYGLWVSKPGQNVETCAQDQLLFDSTLDTYGQVLARGSVSTSTNITVPTRNGINPIVMYRLYDSGNTVLSTRRGATSPLAFMINGADAVSISFSTSGNSSTVTIAPNSDLGLDVAYVIIYPT